MPTTFIEETLDAQAFGYAVCAVQSNALAIDDSIYGECGCEHDCRAMYYQWGVELMNRTEATDCDCAGRCVDPEFACKVINLLNPGCIVCGCGSPDDVPVSCEIVQNRAVFQALDADQELVGPNVAGRTTLIITNQTPVTNNWSAHVGEVATDDGAGNFTYTALTVGDIVLDSGTGTYYVAYAGGAGPLYPEIDGTLVFLVLTLFSRWPGVTAQYSRDVVVEISPDGVTWTPIYSGPEAALLTGYVVPTPVTTSPTFTRTTYFYAEENACSTDPVDGSIPPFVAPPCGILVYTMTPEADCGTDEWNIAANFTQIDGWNIGSMTTTVNGVTGTPVPITLGTTTLGPFVLGDTVSVLLENNIDIACNVTEGPFVDPRLPAEDFTVLRAVDANEYAALNGDGEDYFIVSNVDGLVADWGLHLNEIWLGGTSTYQVVADQEVVYATNPGGALGYWQLDGSVSVQVYPQPIITQNTVTLVWTAEPGGPAAPFLAGTNVVLQGFCGGTPFGNIYVGVIEGFVLMPLPTTPPCGFGSVVGIMRYIGADACPVVVDAIVEQFTPTGEPDPDFVGLGVNSIVRAGADSGLGDGSFYIGGSFTLYDAAGAKIPAGGFTRFNTDGTLDTAFNSLITDTSFMRITGATGLGVDANGLYTQGPNVNGRVSYEFTFSGTDYAIAWSGARWEILNVTLATVLYFSATNTTFPSAALSWTVGTGTGTPVVTTGGFLAGRATARINAVKVDSLNRVVVAGDFDTWNDQPVGKIIRFLSTGARDVTFNPAGVGFVATTVFDISLFSDDSMIATLAGIPPTYNGVAFRWVCHISAAGALITTEQWSPTLNGFNGGALRSAIDPDGTVVFNGNAYDLYNNQLVAPSYPNQPLVRVNPDGTLNSIIAQGTQFFEPSPPTSRDFAIQPDGKIIAVGNFSNYNGTATGNIIRIDAFGTPDAAFVTNSGTGFDDQTLGVDLLPNGWIMVGSNAGASYDGTLTGGLTRLRADGLIEPTWNLGTGFNGAVYFVVVDSFGDQIVGGNFTALDGTTYNYVVKL